MLLEIKINCDDDALSSDPVGELARILGTVPDKVREQLAREPTLCNAPEAADKLRDINGNTVGFVRIKR